MANEIDADGESVPDCPHSLSEALNMAWSYGFSVHMLASKDITTCSIFSNTDDDMLAKCSAKDPILAIYLALCNHLGFKSGQNKAKLTAAQED